MSILMLGQDEKYLRRKAGYEGLIVLLPKPNEVFLDLDTPTGVENSKVRHYLSKMSTDSDWPGITKEQLQENYPQGIQVISELVTTSKGGNTHKYLRMSKDLTDLERVIVQISLGSDPVKELFSFIQLNHFGGFEVNCECPVALFETPSEAARVEAWRAQ